MIPTKRLTAEEIERMRQGLSESEAWPDDLEDALDALEAAHGEIEWWKKAAKDTDGLLTGVIKQKDAEIERLKSEHDLTFQALEEKIYAQFDLLCKAEEMAKFYETRLSGTDKAVAMAFLSSLSEYRKKGGIEK